jgi:arylsulfatase A-like enzyme/Tfp pilus assembly protein PilF
MAAKLKNKKLFIRHCSVLVGVALAIGAACYFRSSTVCPKEIRNVLLISIDTCRADHLGCYGYQLNTTPNIDAVASEGVLFENVISPVPFTLPAHCSMLTGTIPPCHGVFDNTEYKLGAEFVTLAEILKDNGFTTSAFISAFVLNSRFGLAQGFDTYDDSFENPMNTTGINERRGDETTRRALKWLENHKNEKNFIFLHYYDPHFTYEPPEPFASRFRNVPSPKNVIIDFAQALFGNYAGEIAYTDYCIGQVIDKLKQLKLYDSTMIIITADHGEMLGQHGEGFHGYFIYQQAVKVPLIFRLPGQSKSTRIKDTVGLIDIVPTACSSLGIEPPPQIQGRDLTPYFHSNSQPYPNGYLYCQSLEPTKYGANSLLGIATDRYKYIQTTRPELYDLADDPQELNNLADQQPNRTRVMQDKLQQILDESVRINTPDSKPELDEQTRLRLESLGYVGGSIDEDLAFNQDKEDPKDLIDYHVRSMQVCYLIHTEKYETATEKCQQLISQRPSFYRSYFDLAKILLKQEDFAEAIPHLQKSIELKPDHAHSHEGLALAFKSQGKIDQAIDHYVKTLELKPDYVEAYYQLALCFYEQRKYRAAEKYLSKALLENPSYVEAAISLGDKLLEKGQIKAAYDHWLHILKLKPDSVTTLNTLAWLQAASDISELRNPEQAIHRARRACELSGYKKPETLDTLAVAYAAAGAFDKAIERIQKAIDLAKSENRNDLAEEFQSRIRLYKTGRTYFDPGLRQENSSGQEQSPK